MGDRRGRPRNGPHLGRLSLGVNKRYDLADPAELEDVLSELVGLIRDGTLPPDTFTYTAP
jgi:hypothetical protein